MRLSFFLTVVIFCLFCFDVQAQSNTEDVVYLKNGGVTRGVILEIIPDTTVKIQTKDRNIFVYKLSEIDKILKEPLPIVKEEVVVTERPVSNDTPTAVVPVKKSKSEFKQEGFHNITKLGPLGFNSYSINVINGYQFNPYILLGLGVGLDTYKGLTRGTDLLPFTNGTQQNTDYFLPIYLDFRFHVSEARATFLVFFDMGYSVHLGRSISKTNTGYNPYYNNSNYGYMVERGGTFFCPGIGLKVFMNKNIGFIADLGMKFQNYYSKGPYNYTTTTVNSPGLVIGPVLNFGLAF
jgi:hypothetical protein